MRATASLGITYETTLWFVAVDRSPHDVRPDQRSKVNGRYLILPGAAHSQYRLSTFVCLRSVLLRGPACLANSTDARPTAASAPPWTSPRALAAPQASADSPGADSPVVFPAARRCPFSVACASGLLHWLPLWRAGLFGVTPFGFGCTGVGCTAPFGCTAFGGAPPFGCATGGGAPPFGCAAGGGAPPLGRAAGGGPPAGFAFACNAAGGA